MTILAQSGRAVKRPAKIEAAPARTLRVQRRAKAPAPWANLAYTPTECGLAAMDGDEGRCRELLLAAAAKTEASLADIPYLGRDPRLQALLERVRALAASEEAPG